MRVFDARHQTRRRRAQPLQPVRGEVVVDDGAFFDAAILHGVGADVDGVQDVERNWKQRAPN